MFSNWRSWSVFHTLFFVTFVASGILVNIVQTVAWLLIGWHNIDLFRKINFYCIYALYGQILFLANWWSGCRLRVHYELAKPSQDGTYSLLSNFPPEHMILIMNHHCEIDWMFAWMAADQVHRLGNCRVIAKKVLRFIPVLGWAWVFSDNIYLARKWEDDKDILAKGIQTLGEFPDPMSLCMFAEGTRLSQQKLEASQEYAKKNNMPVLKHHLLPRTRGFTQMALHMDRTKIESVYDATVCINGDASKATLWSLLTGRSTYGEMYLRRIPTSILPDTEEGLNQWMIDLYVNKDKMKERYLQTGTFSDTAEIIDVDARPTTLLLMIALNVLISVPLFKWLIEVVFFGTWLQAGIAVGIVVGVNLLMGQAINTTKISKQSAYGIKNKKDE